MAMSDTERIWVSARLDLHENLLANLLTMIFANKPDSMVERKRIELRSALMAANVSEDASPDAPMFEIQTEVLRQFDVFWKRVLQNIEMTRTE